MNSTLGTPLPFSSLKSSVGASGMRLHTRLKPGQGERDFPDSFTQAKASYNVLDLCACLY